MSDNPEQPFGHATVTFPAVLVPDDEVDQHSPAEIAGILGHDVARIPAVIVPEGGSPPGYPYEHVADAVIHFSSGGAAFETPMSPSHDATPDEGGAPPELPGTRFRFGAALLGRPGVTPNPTAALRQGDPISAGIKAWRRLGSNRPQSADMPGNAAGAAGPNSNPVRRGGIDDTLPAVQSEPNV